MPDAADPRPGAELPAHIIARERASKMVYVKLGPIPPDGDFPGDPRPDCHLASLDITASGWTADDLRAIATYLDRRAGREQPRGEAEACNTTDTNKDDCHGTTPPTGGSGQGVPRQGGCGGRSQHEEQQSDRDATAPGGVPRDGGQAGVRSEGGATDAARYGERVEVIQPQPGSEQARGEADLLREAQAVVCSSLCPSVKMTNEPWTHCDLCTRMRAALAAAPAGAGREGT